MGISIAVILGVANYDTQPSLPGCSFDTAAIQTLLTTSEKFEEVVVIDSTKSFANVKADMAEMFRRVAGASVDDFIFYFSGHGDVIDDEFRFVLRDFDRTKPNLTSIASSELDEMVRGIKPRLYCKIVDACHSGVSYVKNNDSITRSLEKSKAEFQCCYFLYSCQQDQKSFATEHLSDFTKALLQSVRDYPSDAMRYHDLASALADHFRSSEMQTPFFVHQGSMTEIFLHDLPKIRQVVSDLVLSKPQILDDGISGVSQASPPMLLLDRVRINAQEYLDQSQATQLLINIRNDLKAKTLTGQLAELYECNLEEVYELSFGEMTIANWFRERPAGSYFVELDFDTVYTDFLGNELGYAEVDAMRRRSGSMGSIFGAVYRQKTRLSGFHLTENGPWDVLLLTASPKFPNIPKWVLQMTHATGPKAVVIFAGVSLMVRSGWNSYRAATKVDWVIEEFGAQKIEKASLADELFERLRLQIVGALEKQFEDK